MDVDIDDVKRVLRPCFGFNKDMAQVIADPIAVAVASMATEGGASAGGGRDVYVPTTMKMRHGRRERG